MLSIQQLIKALRKLQNISSAASGAELVKSLKHAATTTPQQEALVTSLLTAHGVITSPTSIATKQQPQTNDNRQQAAAAATQVASETTRIGNISLDTHALADECHRSIAASASETSKYAKNVNTTIAHATINCKKTAGYIDEVKAATTTLHCHQQQQSSQQNFFQQKLHHFHTQHNQCLHSKQTKQTQFAMSSLAAEPVIVKQDEQIASSTASAANGNADNAAEQPSGTAGATDKPSLSAGYAEILQFMELIGNLKHTKRTGWVLRDVNDCESISGHMYRMSMMTFLLDGSEGLNQIRCMELALVHDLAESLVGDITPFCGVTKEDKRAMEFKAMEDICKLIEPRGKRIMELFEEYEEGDSAESKFVKDLDRLDMVMQAFEYEKRDNCLLKHQEFFDSTAGKFKHPFVQKLVNEIYEQRKILAKAKSAVPPPRIVVPNTDAAANAENGHCAAHQQKNTSTSSS